jgi:dipeptidyl aminopeptidase/acylaminoacyl peptidase
MNEAYATCRPLVFALGLLLCVAGGPSRAADDVPGPVPVETFFRHADTYGAQLSPSGRRLAIATGAGGSRVALAVADLQDNGNTKLAARFDDLDIRDFQWVNEDTLVFRVIDLTSGGGDQRFAPGLFSVKADGSDLRQLVKLRREFVVRQRIVREPLEWNHDLLAVPGGGGNEVIVGRIVFDGAGDRVAVYPLRLDVTTQRTRSIAGNAPDHAVGWLFDPRGEPRVVVAQHEGRTGIHWRAPGQDGWKQIASFGTLDMAFAPRFVDSRGQLLVTAAEGPGGHRVLKRFDFAAGRPEPDALVDTPGFDFQGQPVAAGDESGRPMGYRVVTDAETTIWLDERMKKTQEAVDARLPGRVNRLTCRRCGTDDMTVLVLSWSDQEPGEFFVYHPARNAWRSVGRVRRDVDPKQMARLDLHRIRARDGLELPVWVTLPKDADRKAARPAVVLVHGGPWMRGVHWQWNETAQFLASRGYVVIEPEFRMSTGYGTKLFRAGWKQWGLAMQDDLADALEWAVGQGWVDARRVCIAGASYGGYAVLMGLVRHPELYRCGVAWAAVTDPRLLFEASWISSMPDEVRMYQLPTLIGDPKVDAAALAAVAPVEQAGRIKAPLLLAFGGRDSRVPLEHGTRMRDALRAAGRDPEWVVYAEEGHGWLKQENRFDFARRMERFLDRNLK